MRKFLKATAASVALLGLAGCATGFPAQVSRYQAMPAPNGETFAVVPMNEADAGGLEFSRYAEMVAAELREEGYTQAADPAAASMIVSLGYRVDDGRERIVDPYPGLYDPRFRFGVAFGRAYHPFYPYRYARHRYYGPRLGFAWGWDDPFWYGRGIRSYTEYRSVLELDIRRAEDNQAVFEGTAKARSRTDELGTLVPNLIEAMFTDFPGRNGETVKITVRGDEDARR
ncbi:DUF4136 domain-containing protein [Sphingomicrobium astaxanthinifaciens]|uniref:DUF4136 domain-containing protein n=1 Tax=Sphingomicrobium astaxanthinifaciens TaxID=1227949 RepID=UPI001FCC588B|nr:DUF4136 domain-containing protein [Sphingomicrobium astaxanthinifaciens]MCJ7422113.1 DUF4136 domain-containing protein [Sphingomicrobium astaxanthinifaciens]